MFCVPPKLNTLTLNLFNLDSNLNTLAQYPEWERKNHVGKAMGQTLRPAHRFRKPIPSGFEPVNKWPLVYLPFQDYHMGMDQYLLIPFLGGWTSIYQLFWCSPGVQGFDTLPYIFNCIKLYPIISPIYIKLYPIISPIYPNDMPMISKVVGKNSPWNKWQSLLVVQISGYSHGWWLTRCEYILMIGIFIDSQLSWMCPHHSSSLMATLLHIHMTCPLYSMIVSLSKWLLANTNIRQRNFPWWVKYPNSDSLRPQLYANNIPIISWWSLVYTQLP